MFKQKCPKCDAKISKAYDFCPYCGKGLKSKLDSEDFGLLGKNDFFEEDKLSNVFGGSLLDKMMNNAIKMLEKQMQNLPNESNNNLNKNPNQNPNQNPFNNSNMKIKFMINGKEIPINNLNNPPRKQETKPQKIKTHLSEEKTKNISKLPRKEPETTMKRLSGKLIYELAVPGVKSIDDILINQLENSIEIKAIAKDKLYSKTININLPILNYNLSKENITIEFQAK